MKSSLKQFLILILPFVLAACGGDSPVSEPDLPDEPNKPTPSPTPEENVIETTETGSSTFILLGYTDNVTSGGLLKPTGFTTPIYIYNRKLQGTGYTFAICNGVKRLDAMPQPTTITEWTETLNISVGNTAWARHTSDTEYGYIKLRIAYIEGNEVGVEYKAFKEQRPTIESITHTEDGSQTFLLKGYLQGTSTTDGLIPQEGLSAILLKERKLSGSGYTFAAHPSVNELIALPVPSAVTSWESCAEVTPGACYWVRHMSPTAYTYIKLRVAFLDADNVGIEYKVDSKETIANLNYNAEREGSIYQTDYSIPHLNPDNYYVEHTVTMGGEQILNYALEWNSSLNHAAWIAFTFDEVTTGDVTGRTDAWLPDPQLPAAYQTTNDHHRNDGFDRGHLCASEDRVYSVTANQQTFYFSNITPQFNSFNGGYWAAFEYRVRYWSRYVFSKLHVTKGASLNNLITNYTGTQKDANGVYPTTDADGLTLHGLACPRYYFMALLGELNGNYQALGFWIEHREDYGYEYGDTVPTDVMQQHVVTIDELEELTGLDFFCNLPDQVEERVEAQYDLSDWRW